MTKREKLNAGHVDCIKGDQMKNYSEEDAVISEFMHEEEMFRMERITTRLIISIVLETLLFIVYIAIR